MGKARLEAWRAKREAAAQARLIRPAGRPVRVIAVAPPQQPPVRLLAAHEARVEAAMRRDRRAADARLVTRIVAALIAGVPHRTIAADLRIPTWFVRAVAIKERQI